MKKLFYSSMMLLSSCNLQSEREAVDNLKTRYSIHVEVFDALYKEIMTYKKSDDVSQIKLSFNGDLKNVNISQKDRMGGFIEQIEVSNNNFTIVRPIVSTLKGSTFYFYFNKGYISFPTDLQVLQVYGKRTFLRYYINSSTCDGFSNRTRTEELPIIKVNSEYFICNNLSIEFIPY